MREILTATILISLCLAGGWLIGTTDLTSVRKAIVDSYLNRYNAASGTNVDEVIYYVISDHQIPLNNIAGANDSIRQIEKSDYPRLYNVTLSYTDRLETVAALRALESVSAVFTVPFICH